MKLDDIPINIWDDYSDDGYGEQATYAYIEEYDVLTEQQKEEIMKLVYDFITQLDMSGVKVELAGEDIDFENLTHERREKLVKELQDSGLKYKDIPIDFYSES